MVVRVLRKKSDYRHSARACAVYVEVVPTYKPPRCRGGNEVMHASTGFRAAQPSLPDSRVLRADWLRFEVLEANQRKVLRLRARHLPAAAQSAPR